MSVAEPKTKVVGTSQLRKEDPELITGRGRYVDNISLPGMLWLGIVRSPYAHARIKGIDTSKALELDGVVGAYTADELTFAAPLFMAWPINDEVKNPPHWPLAKDKARHAGDPVAVVLAESRALAKDALELVEVEWEPLPAVTDVKAALADGAPIVHEEFGTNKSYTWTLTNGLPVSIAQAISELRKYANGVKAMGGGFTLSGGEPLMQNRFAVRMFAAAKAMDVHTAIETNGFYGDKLSDAELADIDLVILDMKAFHPEQHERVTGVANNSQVIAFARRLAALGRPMWLRHVLVPGLTDVPEEIAALAAFAASLGVVERVEVLPFHQMGRYKWERLGLNYTLADVQPPSVESVDQAISIFRNAGLKAA